MDSVQQIASKRRPRFQRAPEPPAFRLTENDVRIIREIAQHRFLRSTQIAALVGRSVDRTNDRLCRLFHAGYIDRPRAQLDYYPTTGSTPMVYALADRGARLLADHGVAVLKPECSRKNHEAGRPFIEHQLEVVEFQVAIERAVRQRPDLRIIDPQEIIATSPEPTRRSPRPFSMRVSVPREGAVHEIGIVPDFVFGLMFPDGSRRCFMVEIDRGTMPISRSDYRQTTFARKMHAYLAMHAHGQHERQFGWKTFRVLTVTADAHRLGSMQEALQALHVPNSPGTQLFLFATRNSFDAGDPLGHRWLDGMAAEVQLIPTKL